jgi:hypothetical protein
MSNSGKQGHVGSLLQQCEPGNCWFRAITSDALEPLRPYSCYFFRVKLIQVHSYTESCLRTEGPDEDIARAVRRRERL